MPPSPTMGASTTTNPPAPCASEAAEQARTARLVVVFARIFVATAAVYTGLFGLLGLVTPTLGTLAGTLGGLGVLWVFHRTADRALAAHGLGLSAILAITTTAWVTGGTESMVQTWLLIAPMLTSLVAGRRAGLVWVALGVAAIAVLYALELAGVPQPETVPPLLRTLLGFVVPVPLMAFAAAVTWTYDAANERAVDCLRTSRLATERARDEAQRAGEAAQAILDHVAEGLLLIDEQGRIEPARSAALERHFGVPAPGTSVWDFLRAHDERVAQNVELGWDQLSAGWLPLDVALGQLPTRMAIDGHVFDLSWQPAGHGGVLLVATDASGRTSAELEEAEQQEIAGVVSRMSKNRAAVLEFFDEARRVVDALCEHEGTRAQEGRWIHTLKGNSALMGLERLAAWLHTLETSLAQDQRPCSDVERSMLRNQWSGIEQRCAPFLGRDEANAQLRISVDELDMTLQMLMGDVPRSRVITRMESWAWDAADTQLEYLGDQAKRIAQRLDKSIEVMVDGRGIRTPPTQRWRTLWSSMVHLVRNAVDHGIEPNRSAVGKEGAGLLEMYASSSDEAIRIELRDDGMGIDWDALAASSGRTLHSDEDRIEVLFSDGVSSKDEVTEISGRGIGTAALWDAVHALGGSISVQTERGQFTQFTITVPQNHTVSGLRPVSASA